MKKIVLLFILSINIFSKSIILGSFNTLHLGWDGKNYYETAKIISLFDIVALQEVMKKDGLIRLIKELERISNEKWAYYLSPYPVGNNDKYKEYYAFIYKKNKIEFVKSMGFYSDKNDNFIREPYGAMFKSNKFDFILVNNHLLFGDEKSDRQKEAMELSKVYDYFQNLDLKEQDILILGDFNLPAYDVSFKSLFKNKEKIYYAIDPKYKTTIGKNSLANSYDNIFYSFINTTEYTGNNGTYDYTQNFNDTFGDKRYEYSRKNISDHIPVFIELNTDTDDD